MYAAQIPPGGLLAYIDHERPGEAEYVVNPVYLSDENVRVLESRAPQQGA